MDSGLLKTKQRAEKLAQTLPSRVYALVGDLGAGKTTFVQFFLRALGIQGPITSPTFVIIKKYILYPTPPHLYILAYHIDCYRLNNPQELMALGFAEILADPSAIIIIEWADRVRDLIPASAVWLYCTHGIKKDERIIKKQSM